MPLKALDKLGVDGTTRDARIKTRAASKNRTK
jgi:hypothetical protein